MKEDSFKANVLMKLSDVYFQKSPIESRKYAEQMLQLVNELDWDRGRLRAYNLIGRCYALENNFAMALKNFQNALVLARKTDNPKAEGLLLSSISGVYTTNGDEKQALAYALEAKKVNEKSGIKYMVSLLINIGYLYTTQSKFDEALHIYAEALDQEEKYGTENTIGDYATIYLDLGGVYLRTGDYANSLHNYLQAAGMLEEIEHTRNHTMAIASIGEVYLRIAEGSNTKPLPDSLHNKLTCINKSKHYLTQAQRVAEVLNLTDLRSEVYASFADLYSLTGEWDKAYLYLDNHMVMRDSLLDIDRQKSIARVEAEFAVRHMTDSLNYQNTLKDKQIKEKKQQRNAALIIIVLAGCTALLLINRQKLKHRQKLIAAENEIIRMQDLARQKLDDFTRSIKEKNEMLEKATAEIDKHRNDASDHHKHQSLQTIRNFVILNDEQWIDFQAMFNKVYVGYIDRVKERLPDLTTAELRFVLLTKLNMNPKEMAAISGVSSEAIRVSKHRLLKKIVLPQGMQLDDFVQSI